MNITSYLTNSRKWEKNFKTIHCQSKIDQIIGFGYYNREPTLTYISKYVVNKFIENLKHYLNMYETYK